MPPESAGLVPLTVSGISPEATVTIFDAANNEAWKGSGHDTHVIALPRGFYTVRASVGTNFNEKFVRLANPETVKDVMPKRYSSAPIFASAISHEYYSYTSRDLSKQRTRASLTPTEGAELFVFVRALDEKNYTGADLSADLSIADAVGLILSELSPPETQRDSQFGFMGMCAPAAPGFYRLVVGGRVSRAVGLQLLPGWQTQVFLLHHDGRPLAESLRIFMAPMGMGFEPGDEVPAAADIGLQSLQSGSSELPSAIDVLLRRKFENPMLGFIGAHLLVNRARQLPPDSGERKQCGGLLEEVIRNLGQLAPDAPDTLALQTLEALHFGGGLPMVSLRVPPMLRAGLSAVVFAAAEYPHLIEDDSLTDHVASKVFQDSPWTTWDDRPTLDLPSFRVPPPVATRRGIPDIRSTGAIVRRTITNLQRLVIRSRQAGWFPVRLGTTSDWDWIEYALVDELMKVLKRGTDDPPITVAGIARKLGVTPNAIRRALTKLDQVSLAQLTRIAEPHPMVQDLIVRHGDKLSLLNLVSLPKE